MARPSSEAVHIPLGELTEPQVIFEPSLIAAGITIEVLDLSAGSMHLGTLGFELPPEVQQRVDDQAASVRLVLGCADETVECELLDAQGEPVCGPAIVITGDERRLVFSTETRFSTTAGEQVIDNRHATTLEIRIPVRFEPITGDPVAHLRHLIDRSLPAHPDLLAGFVPSIRLVPRPLDPSAELPIGASRLHGLPDLPSDIEWPTWIGPEADPALADLGADLPELAPGPGPLAFLAQIDLAALPTVPASPLPTDGWLVFFGDVVRGFGSPAPQDAFLVLHVPSGESLDRRSPPAGAPVGGAAAVLDFVVEVSAPLDLIYSRLRDVPEPARTEIEDAAGAAYEASVADHMLGNAISMQDDPLVEAAAEEWRMSGGAWDRDELIARRGRWTLLFEWGIDQRFREPGVGDGFYFCMRNDDLEAERFERVVVINQK